MPGRQSTGYCKRHRREAETVNRAIKYLVEHNFVQIVKAGGNRLHSQ